MITVFVFVMMLLLDFIDAVSKRRLSEIIKGGAWRQYTLASFLGSTPGCLGAFMNVSLYVHGMISFGAIVGGMIATSGDEAFVMLAQFPGTALVLFLMLFILGIFFAWISDKLVPVLRIVPCESCENILSEECLSGSEYKEKISDIFRPANFFKNFRNFVMMYAQGLIPFSVLFTVSFVQDGHGMLPLLSYSLKDSVLIKLFNLVFGLVAGSILFAIGI